jgi:hypothetical protein
MKISVEVATSETKKNDVTYNYYDITKGWVHSGLQPEIWNDPHFCAFVSSDCCCCQFHKQMFKK